MKKALLALIALLILGLLIFNLSINKSNPTEKDFISFFEKQPAEAFTFSLYDPQTTPLSLSAIQSINGSYADLVELGKNSKYQIKVPQIEHEEAVNQLKFFYQFVVDMNECKKEFLLSHCKAEGSQLKAEKLLSYIDEQIFKGAKLPYGNGKEYFYLSYKSIVMEEFRGAKK